MTRTVRVQFLALMAMLTLFLVPALAADDSAPTDTPDEQLAPPAVEPAQAIDETSTIDALEGQLNKIIQKLADAAQTFTPRAPAPSVAQSNDPVTVQVVKALINGTAAPANDGAPQFVKSIIKGTESAAQAAQKDFVAGLGDEDPEFNPEPAVAEKPPADEAVVKEAEIDSISASLDAERIRSARRIAELEQQLDEARQSLVSITSLDGEGFIRTWLILAPISVDAKVSNHDEESNKPLLDRQYVSSQATPRDGDKATIDGTELTWKTVKSSDFSVDLAKVAVDQELESEHAAYLDIAYVTSAQEVTGVKLAIGSDDDSVWRLNGKEVIRSYSGRGVAKDQDSADDLTLKQGVNVLSFTVLNGEGPAAAAARFVDEDGNPVKGLKISLTPPATQQITKTDPEAQQEE